MPIMEHLLELLEKCNAARQDHPANRQMAQPFQRVGPQAPSAEVPEKLMQLRATCHVVQDKEGDHLHQ